MTAASARVRIAGFEPYLRPHGVELSYRPTLTDDEYTVLASQAPAARKAIVLAASSARAILARPTNDVFLVHRLRLLNPLPGIDPPRRLDAYDIDDALFLSSPAKANRHYQWAKREASRCIDYLRRARLIVVGNSFLAGKAREYGHRVEIVPSCVDPTHQPLHAHAEATVATVGWIGSPTTSPYLESVLPVFARLNDDRLRAKLVVVGADTGLRDPWIEHRPWTLATERSDLASFDIGIMPLPDTDWARGKCGYKILQYFSAGVPAIASPVGMTRELIGDERGMLASSHSEWQAAINQLASGAVERHERGRAARAFVERGFSYARWAPELAAMLRSLG